MRLLPLAIILELLVCSCSDLDAPASPCPAPTVTGVGWCTQYQSATCSACPVTVLCPGWCVVTDGSVPTRCDAGAD